MNLPGEIYSVESVRKIDRAAIDGAGIGGYALMTRAGSAALAAALEHYPDAKRWQVVCGSGNNGGDGYVVARLAAEQGIAVSALSMVSPDDLGGDASTAYMDFAALGGAVSRYEGSLDEDADLLVDGLLGSGLERDVEGDFARVIEQMNSHPAPVLALDLPSGLHGDSGKVLGTAVRAAVTVTFVGLKSGLFLDAGAEHCGELVFAGLDIPADCRAREQAMMRRIDDGILQKALPRRKRSAHKGKFGHVLVVGGGPGMPGAVRLCGEAALRSGAGLVSVATHPDHSQQVSAGRPELMCHAVSGADDLEPLLAKATVIAVGPGMGQDEWARELLGAVLGSDKPVVVDADALNLLPDLELRHADLILTPHPGEAGTLLGTGTQEVQADRCAALKAIAEKFGGTVVLKGSGTLVSSKRGQPWLCSAGNPGMASPGMGDALTGIIAALRAQKLSSELAAVAGVQVHARAGDAAASTGERGLLASDLIGEIRSWVNH
ncbi:MAG: NAD(P)H-hydrate dehydratase [Gammaproteobacteria bacterium]|nr:NAD(P)H-hydrate dehydratase [Gammaproteobacteria bacterium]